MGKTNKVTYINANGGYDTFEFGIKPSKTEKKSTPSKKPKCSEEPRDRKFCLTSYIDYNSITHFLKRCEWVQHWAVCYHDSDLNDDGTPKRPHTHILLYTYNAKTASAIKKNFDRYSAEIYRGTDIEPQNTLTQICFDMPTQWRYLIHADDRDK